MHAVMRARELVGQAPRRRWWCGSVLGISNTAVTPPITALSEPVSRSSLWVRPGSRKCTCVSITPGRMCRPRQSTRLRGGGPGQFAECGDPPAGDAEIASALAVVIDDGAALQDQIEALGHSNIPPL